MSGCRSLIFGTGIIQIKKHKQGEERMIDLMLFRRFLNLNEILGWLTLLVLINQLFISLAVANEQLYDIKIPKPATSWCGKRPPKPNFDLNQENPVNLSGFRPQPAMAFYLIVYKPYTRGRIFAHSNEDEYIMLRVFDADERLTYWQYVETGLEQSIKHTRDNYVDGLPNMAITQPDKIPDTYLDGNFALVGEGIHQVRVQGGRSRTTVNLSLSEELPFGVSFQNGDFSPWEGCPENLYVFVPPRASVLRIALKSGALRIKDEDGSLLWDSQMSDGKYETEIGEKAQESVWTFEFPTGNFNFRAWGFPLILCTTPEAARRIRASVEVLEDGTVVCHKFQRRIAELMPGLLDPKNVGCAEDLIEDLATRQEEWLADPLRNAILLTSYATFIRGVDNALRVQDVNPNSRWSGSFEAYQVPEGVSEEDHRWDTFLPVRELGGEQGSDSYKAARGLAKAALLTKNFNPYYGKTELLYRAAASSLRDLMVLNEAEVWPRAADNPYPSTMSFPMGNRNLPPFGLAAPYMPDEIRSVWTEGVRRMLDRSYTNALVTCRNQSSHCLVANEEFARGSGDPVYTKLSRLYAKRFAEGAHPAGWHMERTGPDASYIGMTNWHMAVYYRMSGDENFLDTIRKSYQFFNHTVAPEPNGKMLGGFNFNHRVGEGFYFEQWLGARGILDNILPEVGVWTGEESTAEEKKEQLEEAKRAILRELKNPRKPANPGGDFPAGISDPHFDYYSKPDRSGVFPALEREPFVRNLTDELIAVKRPGYYAICYVGKPAASDYYISQRHDFRLPLPDNAENTGGIINERKVNPYLGGGLSGFWTPDYGHMLLAANWAPTTHHGLIATVSDGKRYWEDYFAHQFSLDNKVGELHIRGAVESLPIIYERGYRFMDDALEIILKIQATEDINLTRLVENIPIARGGWKADGAEMIAKGISNGGVVSDTFRIQDNKRNGVQVSLDSPRSLRFVPDGLKTGGWRKLQIGRVEIELPAKMRKGETAELVYRFVPL
jgi:hypothetical protein